MVITYKGELRHILMKLYKQGCRRFKGERDMRVEAALKEIRSLQKRKEEGNNG